jgi:hypothetical protein
VPERDTSAAFPKQYGVYYPPWEEHMPKGKRITIKLTEEEKKTLTMWAKAAIPLSIIKSRLESPQKQPLRGCS